MRPLLLLMALLLFFPGGLVGGGMITGVFSPKKKWVFFPKDDIRMEVAFDSEFTQFEDRCVGLDVPIYCRWTNTGKKAVKLLLKEHDSYHGVLDYPWGLEVRLTDETGKVITGGEGGWWSSAYLASQISEVERRDAVTLKPGERIARKVRLSEVVTSLLPSPLSGRFRVEIRLGAIQSTQPLTLRLGSECAGGDAVAPSP